MVYPALLPLIGTPRLPAVDWTDAPAGDLNWTRPFRRKTKSGFCACAITLQLACTNQCCVTSQKIEYLVWQTNKNLVHSDTAAYISHYGRTAGCTPGHTLQTDNQLLCRDDIKASWCINCCDSWTPVWFHEICKVACCSLISAFVMIALPGYSVPVLPDKRAAGQP